jgi:hypothetical protein
MTFVQLSLLGQANKLLTVGGKDSVLSGSMAQTCHVAQTTGFPDMAVGLWLE